MSLKVGIQLYSVRNFKQTQAAAWGPRRAGYRYRKLPTTMPKDPGVGFGLSARDEGQADDLGLSIIGSHLPWKPESLDPV